MGAALGGYCVRLVAALMSGTTNFGLKPREPGSCGYLSFAGRLG